MERRALGDDVTRLGTAGVCCVDLNAHGDATTGRVNVGRNRSHAFTKNHIGATVQNSERLRVPLDGHCRNGMLRGEFVKLNPHFCAQFASVNTDQRFEVQGLGELAPLHVCSFD